MPGLFRPGTPFHTMFGTLTRSLPSRGRWLAGGTLVLLLGGALYLNRASARWIPEAEARVREAQQQAAGNRLAELEREAAEQPRSAAAQLELAQALADQGHLMRALLPAEKAVRADPKSAKAHLLLAQICAPLDYQERAETHYREALRLDPDRLETYQLLGALWSAQGKREAARNLYQEAMRRAPAAAGPRISAAELAVQDRRGNDALKLLEPVLKMDDPPIAALFLGGKAGVIVGRTREAEEWLTRVIARAPDFAEAHHELGALRCNRGDSAEGIASLRKATELEPRNPTFFYALGNALRVDTSQPDRLEKARRAYEISLELDPRQDWCHYYYGTVLESLGEKEAATREFLRTLKVNPRFGSAYYRLGALYRSAGKTEQARRYFEAFNRENLQAIAEVHGKRRTNSVIDTAQAHYERALALLRKGDRDAAVTELQVALTRDPSHSPSRRQLRSMGAE